MATSLAVLKRAAASINSFGNTAAGVITTPFMILVPPGTKEYYLDYYYDEYGNRIYGDSRRIV